MTEKKTGAAKRAKANKTSKKKARIGHASEERRVAVLGADWEAETPRGWIAPNGRFISSQQHWEAIADALGEKQSRHDAAAGERCAHRAYALGWISIGHGGAFNAIGHAKVFDDLQHPAVVTLRKLVAKVPHFSLRVEKQLGKLDPVQGRHEDFDVHEYDLVFFIRRGRLRKTT